MGERRRLFSCCHILKYVRIGEEGEVSLLISIESPTLHYVTIYSTLRFFPFHAKFTVLSYLKYIILIIINL